MGSWSRLILLPRGPEVCEKFIPEVSGGVGQPFTWPSVPHPLGIQIWADGGGVGSSALPSRKKNNFVSCLTSRAEEEDEHLERTLEQNKGKMAKKEEKCVLQ